MVWYPRNANDVEFIITQVIRDDSGTATSRQTLGSTARITVDEFSIDTDEDLEVLSGVGQAEGRGTSRGNVEHTWSCTIQGEDAELFSSLASEDGRSVELEIIARTDRYRDKLTGVYAGTRNLSASDGDPLEYEAGGTAESRDPSVR